MTGTVGIIGSGDRQVEELVQAAGMRPVILQADQLASSSRPLTSMPDVIVVDVRTDRHLLSVISTIKRRYPTMGVAIVVPSLEPELMLEAMRAGVSECIPEPLTQGSIETAITRVMVQRTAPLEGRVFAVIGAKGGVGATTVAVNVAESMAQSLGDALLIDLNVATGDAAVFLGVEPRFTVIEALENTHRLDEAFFRGLVVHTRSGLDLLGSSQRIAAGAVDAQQVRKLIDFAARYYRAVVLDVPRGDSAVIDALEAAATILVVVNHELPTVRSAYRLVANLRHRYGSDRIGLVVNRADRTAEISVEDIEKAVHTKVRHVLPSDYKAAVAAINKGEPLARAGQTRLASSLHGLSRALIGQEKEKDTTDANAGGMFGWLTPRKQSRVTG
jgi:pilus assembly protein CpaE